MDTILSSPDIYLASQSPRRRELLDQIGVSYQVVYTEVDESLRHGECPRDYVERLSKEKARVGAHDHWDKPVLGADTIVVLNGEALGKPKNKEDAINILLRLSGQSHEVMTAVSIVLGECCETRVMATQVTFRALSLAEIECYWMTGEPQDKAGAYGIQGVGAVFVEKIIGSYSAVVGLPLVETAELLALFDINVLGDNKC